MTVIRFAAQNFRNIADEEIFPCEEVNVIYGGNAQGKTNLLEGLWLFTGGHSFRGAKDTELPRLDKPTGKNSPSTTIEMDFFSEDREQNAVLQIESGRRTSWINEVKKNSGSPEHLMLIKEGPPYRRKFIDTALCQIKPSYAGLMVNYRKTVAQRNALLKEIAKDPKMMGTVSVWDARTADLGARVMEERRQFISNIEPFIQETFQGISKGRESIHISYVPSFQPGNSVQETAALFVKELERTVSSDVRSGFTITGPHRDDIEIQINGVSARVYGSQGQQRSAVLAMKLAEARILEECTGEAPIVLLDDVLSELDKERQDYLLNHLHDQQVFITCCEPDTVDIMKTGMRFHVESGIIYPEEA